MQKLYHIKANDIFHNLRNLPQLVFEVTDACNLRCKYCGYGNIYEGYDKRENLNFSLYRAKTIIDYLHSLWKKKHCVDVTQVMSIGFYGGEPLLNIILIKDIIQYIESLSFVGKKFIYSMTTNGILLDEHMDYLVQKQFRLLISLDGDKEAQSYRVNANNQNSFEKVFNNVNLLRNKHSEYFNKFVRFNSVLHNKNSVGSIYYFIKNTFGKIPSITPLNSSGIKPEMIEEFNKTYQNYNESIKEAANCEALRADLFIDNPETRKILNYLYYNTDTVFGGFNDLLKQKTKGINIPTGTCIPFSKKMFITVKGRILQCERINHEFALGWVTDEGVKLDFEAIAKQHNDYVFRYAKQCEKCGNRTACMQCVYQIDDIHDPNTRCRGFCTEAQKEKQNEQCLRYLSEHPELYKRLLNEVVIRG